MTCLAEDRGAYWLKYFQMYSALQMYVLTYLQTYVFKMHYLISSSCIFLWFSGKLTAFPFLASFTDNVLVSSRTKKTDIIVQFNADSL